MKTLIKSIIYCRTVPLDCLPIEKIVCQASLLFIPNLVSKSGNILFRSMPNYQMEIVCSAQHLCHR